MIADTVRPQPQVRYEELRLRHPILRRAVPTFNCPDLKSVHLGLLVDLVTLVLRPESRDLLLDALAPHLVDIVMAVEEGARG